jgi:homopolymeric O-antigen transport system permease protein
VAGPILTRAGRTRPAEAEAGAELKDAARGRRVSALQFRDLVLHLARREVDAAHHMTVLGWAWPLTRQLAQLAVLVFVFSRVLKLGIPDYPVFVFSGLIAWSWFATGTAKATGSLIEHRHLLFQPRFPARVVPIVAIVVPLVDVLFALPVLLLMLGLGRGLAVSVLILPLIVLLQLVLMAGFAWLLAAASVFFRDMANLVGVALLLIFYLTPVFYSRHNVPGKYAVILSLNPIGILIEAYRHVLLGTPGPSWLTLGALSAFSLVTAVLGYAVFTHVESRFVDHV